MRASPTASHTALHGALLTDAVLTCARTQSAQSPPAQPSVRSQASPGLAPARNGLGPPPFVVGPLVSMCPQHCADPVPTSVRPHVCSPAHRHGMQGQWGSGAAQVFRAQLSLRMLREEFTQGRSVLACTHWSEKCLLVPRHWVSGAWDRVRPVGAATHAENLHGGCLWAVRLAHPRVLSALLQGP